MDEGKAKKKRTLVGKNALAARAQVMALHKLLGESRKEIAEQFNCSPETVTRALSLARKSELFGIAEQVVHTKLLPKALAVYNYHLERGELDAARDVLNGTGVLKKNGGITVNAGHGEVTLDVIRARIRAKQTGETSYGAAGSEGSLLPVIDVESEAAEGGPETNVEAPHAEPGDVEVTDN